MSNLDQAIFILIPVLLVSMSIHEMLHALAADWLGDPTARLMGRVSFNPLDHIDPIFTVLMPVLFLLAGGPLFAAAKPVQVNFSRLRYGEFGGAIVGMIGPLSNLLIAIVAALVFNHFPPSSDLAYNIFRITIELNIGLFIFNSIPWPPLDGSRLLYAFAPRPVQEVMESIEHLGMAGLVFFVLVFYQFGNHIGNLIADLAHLLAPGLVL